MMNVGENRARNGVTDCPESRNEENFQSIELLDSSRHQKSPIIPGIVYTSPDRRFTRRNSSDQSRPRSSRKYGFEVPAAVGQNLSTAVQ
ncbi:hypothetical protein E3N88_10708 [Mikania micrantha]|uniref:Uncharacterized protein n=1 Tax=Mikania micrantha TaxID=192012 RepID=A0A5N6PDM6_9ASTR|nr:hypothetical protein E3N88_10708 [Mikania micrantha]